MDNLLDKRFVIRGCDDADKEYIASGTISYAQDAWRRLKKNPIAMASLVVLTLLVAIID